jgi:hypothetical protein
MSRELDERVAVEVMGWIPWLEQRGPYRYVVFQRDDMPLWNRRREGDADRYTPIDIKDIDHHKHIVCLDNFKPSTDPASMMQVVEKMIKTHSCTIECDEGHYWCCFSTATTRGDGTSKTSLPQAVALAALEAVRSTVKPNPSVQ